jgi:hypothetical protein
MGQKEKTQELYSLLFLQVDKQQNENQHLELGHQPPAATDGYINALGGSILNTTPFSTSFLILSHA